MNFGNSERPTDQEILSELDRILASSHFKKSVTQFKLLQFVVERTMEGKETREIDIFVELYGNAAIPTNKVRAGANIVRAKLRDYYDNEGKNDPVTIAFPPGPPYKAQASYNEQAGAMQELKRALAWRDKVTLEWLYISAASIKEVIRGNPSFAVAYELLAENCLLELLLLHAVLDERSRSQKLSEKGIQCAETAITLNPHSWRSCIVIASFVALEYDFPRAGEWIERALKANPECAGSSLYYAAYLLTTGRLEEAKRIVRSKINESPASLGVNLGAAFLLYLMRDVKEALKCLMLTWGLDWQCDLHRIIAVFVKLADEDLGFGLSVLSKVSTFDVIQHLPGLMILCLMRTGETERAREIFIKVRNERRRKPLQFALAYMAFGQKGRAIVSLFHAYRQGDIFFNWIHQLPILDPLRDHPRFKKMVEGLEQKQGFHSP